MRKPGTDLMATGLILGSTALAVAATLALARADSGETRGSTADCTPLEAQWAVTYAVSVDGDGVSGQSAPVRWRWHTRVPAPRAAHEAAHRCRRVTVGLTEDAEEVRKRLEELKERLRTLARSR